MATVTLKDILGYMSLTGMVNTNVPGLPRRLPKGFYTGTPDKVEGDQFRYHLFTHARSVASLNTYYAPSKPRQLRPVGVRDVKLFHTSENITFDAVVLEALRNFDNYELQEKGKVWVGKQVQEFRRLFKNLRDLVALLVLTKGVVYRDGNNVILPSSSGAVFTSDFGIPAGNQGTIAAVSGVGGAWNSPTTNIMLQLETMKIKAQQAHGYEPEIILYGKNIPTYLANNDHLQPFLVRNAQVRDELVKDGYIGPSHQLLGYDWYPVSDAGFQDLTGTYNLTMGADDIVLCPKPSEEWWGWAEGSYMVPSTLDKLADLDALVGGGEKVYGTFAYAKMIDDPMRMVGISGDTFCPYAKIPEAVWQLTAV